MDFAQPVAGNGDTAVDRRVETQVPIAGTARGECPDAIQIDDVFPMALHECRGWELFSELMQTLHGAVGFFAFGLDERVAFFGFQLKNGVRLDQVNRSV